MERSQQIDWVIIDGECMIVSYLTNSTLFLNKTSTFIWKLILENKNIDSIIEICARYCEKNIVSKQVQDFIEQLKKHKIIKDN